MDAQSFLAEFGHIASAPDGLKRLRGMILLCAISGRLTNTSREGSASKIISQIGSSIEGEAKKRGLSWKKYHGDFSFKLPLGIPQTWGLAKLNEITLINMGQSPDSVDVSEILGYGLPFYQGKAEFGELYPSPKKWCNKPKKIAIKDDILISVRAPVGPTNLCLEESCIGRGIAAISPMRGVDKSFLLYVLRGLEKNIAALGVGSTFAAISLKDIQGIPVPVPSLEEQESIVTKINQLLALCDKLELLQQERRALCTKTREITLAELVGSKPMNELHESWNRTLASLSLLIDGPDAVEEIKAAIRELTVRGSLVETSDDSVDSFLQDIQSKKTGKRFAKLTESAEEFSLPNGWQWVLLEDLLAGSNSGWSPKCDPEPRSGDEWGVLKVSAVTWGTYMPQENKNLPRSLEARPEFEVKPGDFLLSRANTAELVARSVIVPDVSPPHLMMSDKIVRLEFIDERVKPWINLVNNSLWARQYYKANATGTSDSMRNVSRQVIHELAIPLPPLSLQTKLLEKLKLLESHCEQLTSQFTRANETARMFASAAVESITGIRTEEKEELKAPKTELISKLRIGINPNTKEQAPLAVILARHNGELLAKDLWQRYGGEIDAFYQQLKVEVGRGWILEPGVAELREVETA